MQFFRRTVSLGTFIISLSLLATLVLWLATLSDYGFILHDPFLFLSKAVVLTGTAAMCWVFILSTRLFLFEDLFSGLDKVYHIHRLLAIWAFSLICLHPLFQLFRYLPDWQEAYAQLNPATSGPVAFGWISLAAFFLLFGCTLWFNLPYHVWKRTHEFFILVLLLAFFHIWLIDRQINASLLLSFWMYGLMAIAVISYVYIRFLYCFIGPSYIYKVTEIEKVRKTWNIFLSPVSDRVMRYRPAQFVYVSFFNDVLGSEIHPYSVSSSPDATLRISVKDLGDYTAKLDALKVGDQARLRGPYGRFYEKYLEQKEKDAVLLAGGIGITPFLSMLAHEADHPGDRKTQIIYCVYDRDRADFHEEILAYAERNPAIHYSLYLSKEGNLDMEKLSRLIGGEFSRYHFFLCGPFPMMKFFQKGLQKAGVRKRDIVFEDFNLLH